MWLILSCKIYVLWDMENVVSAISLNSDDMWSKSCVLSFTAGGKEIVSKDQIIWLVSQVYSRVINFKNFSHKKSFSKKSEEPF